MSRPTGISLDRNVPGHRKIKIDCPSCGKKKCYSRYYDFSTWQYLPERFGRCDRENSCGYHEKPDLAIVSEGYTPRRIKSEVVNKSLNHYEINPFVQWLLSNFDEGLVYESIAKYDVGTARMYGGSTVFWQRDIKGQYRSAKIMGYNPQNGRRIHGQTNWVHTKLYKDNFELEQCLFGEYLASISDLPIAIFESEKTAIIFDLVYPDEYTCLATGGSKNGLGGKSLNREKVKFMRGRQVVLYPDASENGQTFEQWENLMKQMIEYDIDASIVNLDQCLSPKHRKEGLDIADVLLMEYTGIYDRFQDENPNKLAYLPF